MVRQSDKETTKVAQGVTIEVVPVSETSPERACTCTCRWMLVVPATVHVSITIPLVAAGKAFLDWKDRRESKVSLNGSDKICLSLVGSQRPTQKMYAYGTQYDCTAIYYADQSIDGTRVQSAMQRELES